MKTIVLLMLLAASPTYVPLARSAEEPKPQPSIQDAINKWQVYQTKREDVLSQPNRTSTPTAEQKKIPCSFFREQDLREKCEAMEAKN